MKLNLLIVIPAFNESQNIGLVLKELEDVGIFSEILVVDDGSTDGTAEIARNAGVEVLQLPFNLGVGAAMRLGFKYAELRNFQTVIQVDADGQHVPSETLKILDALIDSDVVIGSRFAAGASGFEVSAIRRFAMAILAKSLSRLTGTNLTDVTSGFRATNRRGIELFAETYPPEYLGDTIESLVIAHKHGLKISEVPTEIRQRFSGSSSQSTFKALVYTVRAMVVLVLALLHSPRETKG